MLTFKPETATLNLFGFNHAVTFTQTSEDRPMRITGSGIGDAEPPEFEEYEIHSIELIEEPTKDQEQELDEFTTNVLFKEAEDQLYAGEHLEGWD